MNNILTFSATNILNIDQYGLASIAGKLKFDSSNPSLIISSKNSVNIEFNPLPCDHIPLSLTHVKLNPSCDITA
jgi:hypothetical protein